jgi:hypothetical protein
MAEIRGRYLIRDFIKLVHAKEDKISPKNTYHAILRIYSPEHPKITALVRMTAKGDNILSRIRKELDSLRKKNIIAFCHFEIQQVMR